MKPTYVLPGQGANLDVRTRVVEREKLLDAARSAAPAKPGWSRTEIGLALVAAGFILAAAARWAGWL